MKTAIIYYIEKCFGLVHDDYSYSLINKFLKNETKSFIKKIITDPKMITFCDYINMGKVFSHEEISQIIILIANVKTRIQLTHFSAKLYEVIKNENN
jgi:hypothetical protein